MWQAIKSISGQNNKGKAIEAIKIGNNIISDQNQTAEAFNDYFTDIEKN